MQLDILTGELCPLSQADWEELDRITDDPQLSFTVIRTGDTGEAHRLAKSALIADDDGPSIREPSVAQKVTAFIHSRLSPLLIDRLGLLEPEIMRAQVHRLGVGDFIGHHVDDEYNASYLYSLTLHFKRSYIGGAFVADNGIVFNEKTNALIVCGGGLGHRIEKVVEGERKTLALFIGDRAKGCKRIKEMQ